MKALSWITEEVRSASIILRVHFPTQYTHQAYPEEPHTLYLHTYTQSHTCPLTIPMHVSIPPTNHSLVSIILSNPLYTHVRIYSVPGGQTQIMHSGWFIQLPSLCKPILSDNSARLMAHCRTVSGHLHLRTYLCTDLHSKVDSTYKLVGLS